MESKENGSDFDIVERSLKCLTLTLDDVEGNKADDGNNIVRRRGFGLGMSFTPGLALRHNRHHTVRYSPYPSPIKIKPKRTFGRTQSTTPPIFTYSLNLLTKLRGALGDMDVESAFFLCLPKLNIRTLNSKSTNRNLVSSSVDTCSSQARTPDITVGELAAYFDEYLHLPKKMSKMAEMMYT